MFETKVKQRSLRGLVYLFGALIEVIGFALLFSFENTMSWIHSYNIFFSLFLIITGYIIAVGGRRIK